MKVIKRRRMPSDASCLWCGGGVTLHGKHAVDVSSSVLLGLDSSLWVYLNESQLSHNKFACKPPLPRIMDAALILLV